MKSICDKYIVNIPPNPALLLYSNNLYLNIEWKIGSTSATINYLNQLSKSFKQITVSVGVWLNDCSHWNNYRVKNYTSGFAA